MTQTRIGMLIFRTTNDQHVRVARRNSVAVQKEAQGPPEAKYKSHS